jgi:hypothetical protein
MLGPSRFSTSQTLAIGAALGVDWQIINLEQFRRGLEVELEHGSRDPTTDVTGDDPLLTGKIALAHLREVPDYYSRLDALEAEAEAFWQGQAGVPNRGRTGDEPC